VDEALNALVHLRGASDAQLTEGHVAGLAFNHSEQAGRRLASSQQRIRLPVAYPGPGLGGVRAGGEGPFPGQTAAAGIGAVALATLLPGAAEIGAEGAPAAIFGPDVAVDRLGADPEPSLSPESPGDLLGAPAPLQAADHEAPGPGPEPVVAPGPGAPAPGVPIGQLGVAGAIMGDPIAPELAPNGTAVAPQDPGDDGRALPLLPENGDGVPFSQRR
jgi:hypothetical protein